MGIKEDVDMLDAKIIQLKTNYEQYFTRVLRREPWQLREEIERIIIRNSNVPITNTSLKFKLAGLIAKYTTYKQYWNKMLRAIEEGTLDRHGEGTDGSLSQPARQSGSRAVNLTEDEPLEIYPIETPHRPVAPPSDNGFKKAFEEYILTREKCNEVTKGISYETFKKSLDDQIKNLEKTKGIKDVEVKVAVKDGKTKLTLTPKKTG
ncbi:MAG: MXAN_5187 C-terminal domain-containing protein, partial [Thermodesulfobacteriota bacterium]